MQWEAFISAFCCDVKVKHSLGHGSCCRCHLMPMLLQTCHVVIDPIVQKLLWERFCEEDYVNLSMSSSIIIISSLLLHLSIKQLMLLLSSNKGFKWESEGTYACGPGWHLAVSRQPVLERRSSRATELLHCRTELECFLG